MSSDPLDEITHWMDDLKPYDALSGVEAQLREIALAAQAQAEAAEASAKAAKSQAEAAEKSEKAAKAEKWISLVCAVVSVVVAAADLLLHFLFRG